MSYDKERHKLFPLILPKDAYSQLENTAKQKGVSVSELVRNVLERELGTSFEVVREHSAKQVRKPKN